MATRRTVITGMGWVTPLGDTLDSVWANLLAGKSGVAPTSTFDAGTFPTSFSAEVKGFRLRDYLGDKAEEHEQSSLNTRFALGAAVRAWDHAGLSNYLGLDPTTVGIYLGGGEGPLDFDPCAQAALAGCLSDDGDVVELDTVRWAKTALVVLDANKEREQDPNLAGGHLATFFNVQGPSMNTLTACAASTQATGEAMQIIQRGDAEVMIAGGTHSMIHPLGVTGFNRLTALSTRNESCETASRPFDRTRDGFVLGQGAGIVILEELEHARQREANVLAEVVGYGSTADAFRITDIHEDGRGAVASMRSAMESAGIAPSEVDYISAHGTSTEENDKIESLAIRRVFGEHAGQIPVSSVKSMLGHLIAAAGAVELITCVMAIKDGRIPPTINYSTPDPNCDLDYVPNESRAVDVKVALSNSFGFGGQNDTLIVRAFEEA